MGQKIHFVYLHVTWKEIDVQDRFGSDFSVERKYGKIVWSCSVRGGSQTSTLRFLNVQYYYDDDQLRRSVLPFAVPKSIISKEVRRKLIERHMEWPQEDRGVDK